MTFIRGVFIFAFVMLIAGAVGARLIIGPLLFGDVSTPSYSIAARGATATTTPVPTARPTSVPTHPAPTSTATPRPTARPTASATSAPSPTGTARPTATPRAQRSPTATRTATKVAARKKATVHHKAHATLRPSATPLPSPTPSGIVTLANYWVGSTSSRAGSTIAVGYEIDNQTGATARIELGASVKASSRLNWATDSISDPSHDVVAIVPPGISRHVRYFTLSPGLRSGSYDVAWGLRDPTTGGRVALVAAHSALRVERVIPAP